MVWKCSRKLVPRPFSAVWSSETFCDRAATARGMEFGDRKGNCAPGERIGGTGGRKAGHEGRRVGPQPLIVRGVVGPTYYWWGSSIHALFIYNPYLSFWVTSLITLNLGTQDSFFAPCPSARSPSVPPRYILAVQIYIYGKWTDESRSWRWE